MLLGCDLSNWQPNTPAGYDFYIIKSSEGNGYKDPRLDNHFNNVKEMGKLYGFYHYARPDLGNTPESEADWFLSLVGQHAGNAIFALDWEGASLNYPADWAIRWLRRVFEKTGVKPVLYISQSPVESGKYAAIAKEDYGLWVAQYNGKNAPDLTTRSGWTTWAFWQFTSEPTDKDYFNGDVNAYKKYCGQKKADTKPKPANKLPETIAGEVIAGKWGNGADRKNRLEKAGYDYDEIQKLVNERLKPKNKVATYNTALDVLKNQYGAGDTRKKKLEAAGYDYNKVQEKVNDLIAIATRVIRGDFGNEPQRSENLRRHGWDPKIVQEAVNILI